MVIQSLLTRCPANRAQHENSPYQDELQQDQNC
jgi:hypothetical protein